MRSRHSVALMGLCGTVALAACGAARLGIFDSWGIENIATSIRDRGAIRGAASLSDAPVAGAMTSVVAVAGSLRRPEPAFTPAAMPVGKVAATADPSPPETARTSAAAAPASDDTSPASAPTTPPAPQVQLA